MAAGTLLATDTLIEAKGAFYYPASSKFREVYGEGAIFGPEVSFQTWRQLYTWTSASMFFKEGRSIGLNSQTRIAFYPIGAGVKYLHPVKGMEFYIGAGGLGVYMHIHDHSHGVLSKTCRWGGGGVLKAGWIWNFLSHGFFDLFTDYSFLYVPVSHSSRSITHTANLSGWSIGGAVGYRL
jgi:hypothetical protein